MVSAAQISTPVDSTDSAPDPKSAWKNMVAPYRSSDTARSMFQMLSTWTLYFGLWAAAYFAMDISLWLLIPLNLLISGTLVRLFIIQHDCGHESYFKSERANRIAGSIPGFFMMTPYGPWRHAHAIHHATTGNLEKRGTGDIDTLTVAEFEALTPMKKFMYGIGRNPFIMLLVGPLVVFLIGQRMPTFLVAKPDASDRFSVHLTTVMGLAIWATIIYFFGWKVFLLLHLPSMWTAASAGIFLFYVQHQFEVPYWRHNKEWSYVDACLEGCSHFDLNPVFAWFSGDIGVHHLHHLAPRIPNYKLKECLRANPQLEAHVKLGLWDGIKTLGLRLYDEESGRMIHFRELKRNA